MRMNAPSLLVVLSFCPILIATIGTRQAVALLIICTAAAARVLQWVCRRTYSLPINLHIPVLRMAVSGATYTIITPSFIENIPRQNCSNRSLPDNAIMSNSGAPLPLSLIFSEKHTAPRMRLGLIWASTGWATPATTVHWV